MRRIFIITVIASFCSTANSGEFIALGENGGTYSFTDCIEPLKPNLDVDPTLKGRKAIRAINRSFQRYNQHVDEVNGYLECISVEAGKDLQIYNQAVNATFQERQTELIDDVEAMRVQLELDDDSKPSNQDELSENNLEESLEGGSQLSGRSNVPDDNLQGSEDMFPVSDGNSLPGSQGTDLETPREAISDLAERSSIESSEDSDLTMEPIGR